MTASGLAQKLVLGTVQLGLNYGISNQSGLMPLNHAAELLECAHANGCRTLDTAEAYGLSEHRLGEIGVERFEVISKLAHLPADIGDLETFIYDRITAMLARVKVTAFEGVLLHNPLELLALSDAQLEQTRAGFARLKEEGIIRKCGVSVYTPQDLVAISGRFESDIVQLPCCPLDTRWAQSEIVHELRADGVEIHARSVFLQGLMMMNVEEVPAYFDPWRGLLTRWRNWTSDMGMTPLEACLRISLDNPLFDKLVVGAQSRTELEQQLKILSMPVASLPALGFGTSDEAFLDPSRWQK
jgi:aryl-alcohol dehydrogenase-like predicted oxidoreductase